MKPRGSKFPKVWAQLAARHATVVIEWDDAVTHGETVCTIEQLDEQVPWAKQRTHGCLLSVDEESTFISGEFDPEYDQASNVTRIPTPWITRIKKP